MSSLSAAQFQPMSTEALGLSIGPVVNNETSSPPLNAVLGVVSNAPQSTKQRGSQIRQPTIPATSLPPSSLSQEVHAIPNPPSPSHTASPPSASSNFLPQPHVQQSPPQMNQTSTQPNNYSWVQNRVLPPNLNNGGSSQPATGGPRLSDSWIPPDSDLSPDSLARNKKQVNALDMAEEILQQSPPGRINGDWNGDRRVASGGAIADAMTQRNTTSPTSQLVNPMRGNTNPKGSNNRPRGPTQTSSSPVMVQALRQQTLQQSPPPYANPPAASSSQLRSTPPTSLQGFIPPRDAVNPPRIPLLDRSQTENPAQTAAAQGVRPIQTPPGGNPHTMNGKRESTGSPLGHGRTTTVTSSPPYHTPMESLAGDSGGRTSYMSAVSEGYSSTTYAQPFEYDRDDDGYDVRRRMEQEVRAQKIQEAYLREKTPSPPPVRALPILPAQPQVQPQPSQLPQPQRPNPIPYQPTQPLASSSQGSGFRVPLAPRSFPFQEDLEADDEVLPHQPPPPPPQQSQPQQPPARWTSQSRERDRVPTPPPPPPSQHPPIPIYSPQFTQPGQPSVLNRHDDSTPSPPAPPPAPLRVNPSAPTQPPQEEDLEPAEASSDHFTPKSPNAPLPADHGYHYTNTNVGRLVGGAQQGRGRPNVDPYYDGGYNGLQHHFFAMQMAGMPPPRGPLNNYQNFNNTRDSYTSLSGAAAHITKSESPYPAPPQINTNVNGSGQSGYGGSAEGSGQYEQSWEGQDHWNYADFVEFQRRTRPDAPIPPTPQSYASPQQTHPPQPHNSSNNNNQQQQQQQRGNEQQNQNYSAQNGHGYQNIPNYGNGYGPGGTIDPSRIPDRYIPSALSSYLSSPMMHNPFLPRFPPPQSLVSSPSHIPLDLPPAPIGGRKLHKKKSKRQLRGTASGGSGPGGKSSSAPKAPSKLSQPPAVPAPAPAIEPPRVGAESTVPRDSSTEESDTDDTKKGSTGGKKLSASNGGPSNTVVDETEGEEEEDDDIWLDESSEDELDVEHHSRYIQNPSKRKRKWEQKWDTMIRLFQEIDRTTDSPMLLLASPSTASTPRTHILVSRAIQRNPGKYMPHAQVARQSFVEISKLRRKEKQEAAAAERAKRALGFEQQLAGIGFLGPRFDEGSAGSGGRGSASPASAPGLAALERLQELPQLAAGGEDGLRSALSVALESLKQMHMIYEQREERRREEAERQRQEAAGLESLWSVLQANQTGSPASTGGKASLSGKKSP